MYHNAKRNNIRRDITHTATKKDCKKFRITQNFLQSFSLMRGLLRLHLYDWQGENKFTAGAFGTDQVNVLTVGTHDFLSDGKSKAGSFFVLTAGGVRFVKSVPNQLDLVLWNTDAVVF